MCTVPAPILTLSTILKMLHTNYFSFTLSINEMKNQFRYQKKFLLFFVLVLALSGNSQQRFTITSSRANNYCNGTCTLFDNPELNGNPTAVIFVTPVEVKGINLNPHPICAYYNGKMWSVMNIDNSTMPSGSQFNVQYYSKPDDNHFVHVVTKENLLKSNSYIDHAGLNENSKAQFQFFQNASPNVRGGGVNTNEIKIQYDGAAAKWYITNISGKPLDYATGYNIFISSETNANTNPATTTPVNTTPFVPTTKIDNSGQRVFMTVVGKTQGSFPGENMTTRIEIISFEMEMTSPRDMVSGQASGKRQHFPIIIQKATGVASLQFVKALTTNEQLTTVTFEVYKPSAAGANVLDYKIVLTNAAISNFKQYYIEGQKGFIDSIKFIFQAIEFNNGGTGVSDTWPSIN
jgi:type VI secretion system Hcp family effector